MIPYGSQNIDKNDIEKVAEVLRSQFLTQGPQVGVFERKMADYCSAEAAVAVNSATSALHIACKALGLGSGDSLWTSPNSFIASANCGLYCGADVDFVDIDPKTYNLCPRQLEQKLEKAAGENKLPKIVVPVHFSGQSADMRAIAQLSQKYDFKIIEDASHAVGAEYLNGKVGNCRFSDITVFSFHPVKIITTGEGGLALTNDPMLEQKMRLFANHGMTRDEALLQHCDVGGWYYEQIELGYNYRMTDIAAALGISQMDRLDEFVSRRRSLANRYNAILKDLPVVLPWQSLDGQSAWHIYVIQLVGDLAANREAIFRKLRDCGVGVNVHYIPIHTQPFYQKRGFAWGDFPFAEEYYQRLITLPLFPDLTEKEQNYIVSTLRSAIQSAS